MFDIHLDVMKKCWYFFDSCACSTIVSLDEMGFCQDWKPGVQAVRFFMVTWDDQATQRIHVLILDLLKASNSRKNKKWGVSPMVDFARISDIDWMQVKLATPLLKNKQSSKSVSLLRSVAWGNSGEMPMSAKCRLLVWLPFPLHWTRSLFCSVSCLLALISPFMSLSWTQNSWWNSQIPQHCQRTLTWD